MLSRLRLARLGTVGLRRGCSTHGPAADGFFSYGGCDPNIGQHIQPGRTRCSPRSPPPVSFWTNSPHTYRRRWTGTLVRYWTVPFHLLHWFGSSKKKNAAVLRCFCRLSNLPTEYPISSRLNVTPWHNNIVTTSSVACSLNLIHNYWKFNISHPWEKIPFPQNTGSYLGSSSPTSWLTCWLLPQQHEFSLFISTTGSAHNNWDNICKCTNKTVLSTVVDFHNTQLKCSTCIMISCYIWLKVTASIIHHRVLHTSSEVLNSYSIVTHVSAFQNPAWTRQLPFVFPAAWHRGDKVTLVFNLWSLKLY